VLGSISASTHTVSFHSTEAAAVAGTPSINNTNAYSNTTANQETIWIRVTNNNTGCFDVVPLTLVVHPNPVVNATSLSLCDVNNPGDQQEVFDLTSAISSIVSNPNGLSFAFYTSQANAQSGTNAIANPTAYTNTSNVQAIWVVVTNNDTGCRNITLLDLRVEPLPMVQLPTPLPRECDADGDGFATFDLDALISGLQNGASDVSVTFHETQQNAIDNILAVSGNYQTIFPFLQTIYIRATNTTTGCFRVFDLLLTVEAAPTIPANLPDITLCDADSNPYNGFTTVNLSQQTPLILAAQNGPASQYSVRYFTSEAAAQANTGAIINPGSFINTQNPQTIWVRVTDLATNCFNVDSFEIIVNTPLQPIFPTPLTLCDESLPNNQQTQFDLTVKIPEILQGQAGYTVTFYPTFQNAQSGTNAIANPTAYTNPTGENPKTLGVRITNTSTGCVSFTTLTIRVEPLPEPRMDPQVLEACENAFGSTQASFDLTQAEDYIRNNDANLTFAYFTTLSNAQSNTNAIVDPTNHVAASGEVYVRVANNRVDYTGSNCFVIVTLPIQVNPIPVANAVNYPNCEINTDGFNTFNLLNSDIVAQILGSSQNPSNFTLTYFEDAALTVAINNPTNYTNTTAFTQPIYVVVTNQATQCSNTAVVTLFVENAPQTFPVSSSTSFCDTDGTNDGITTIDLTQYDSQILGNSTNPNFVVYYYDSLATANADMNAGSFGNAIGNPNAYTNSSSPQQTLYAVAVNTATTSGCPQLTTLNITIHTLPETSPQDGTVCLDPNTGNVVTPYLIDSGLSSATHSFVWTDSTGNVVGNASTYTATQAGVYTVVATSLTTNCVSEPQSAIVIESSIATVSYELSNAFSENQTVTITATGITIPNQNGANFVYSLDFGPFQTSNVFTNLTPGEHTVEVRDENGCGSFVFTFTTIDYPKYFTPNGDSYNDHWNIIGLEPQHQAKIYIFDRYGKLLKQISPGSIGWDGNFLGNPLPSTDYWFKVEYLENNQNKEFKAHFTLKR
jgi:valyl-tRNA synthetase